MIFLVKGSLQADERPSTRSLWRDTVDGPENVSRRAEPFETAFFFYRISPKNAIRKEVKLLDKHVLEITDIFRGVFFLCHGGDLCGIRIKKTASALPLSRSEAKG